MRDFIEYLFKQIITNTDALEITEEVLDDTTFYNVKVSPEDMGAAIGKEGRTINSIRALVRAKAIKDNLRVRINLIDDRQEQAIEA